ncbi:MAG: MotA/TolQ/ExbB proton channel family protein [Bacteriovoracaceae bacterium]|nr:MotA/TolQ/ExbB proton channel family protein [Bacteriovoracaceae bacterium]
MDLSSNLKFLLSGGVIMISILVVSVFATAIAIKQYLNLNFNFTINAKFFSKIKALVKDNRLQEAYQHCLTTTHPLSKVLAAILYNSNKSAEAVKSASHIEVQKFIPHLQSGTNYISLSAKVAGLLGLLGTLQGLMPIIPSLVGLNVAGQSGMLIKELSTSLNITSMGIMVAIPCMVLSTWLTNKENSILRKYEEIISEITHLVVFRPIKEIVNQDLNEEKQYYRRYGT